MGKYTPITWKYEWHQYDDRYSLWAEADSYHKIAEDIDKFMAHVCNVHNDRLVPSSDEGCGIVESMTAELVLTWLGYGDLYKLIPDEEVRRVMMNGIMDMAKSDDQNWERLRAHKLAEALTA